MEQLQVLYDRVGVETLGVASSPSSTNPNLPKPHSVPSKAMKSQSSPRLLHAVLQSSMVAEASCIWNIWSVQSPFSQPELST